MPVARDGTTLTSDLTGRFTQPLSGLLISVILALSSIALISSFLSESVGAAPRRPYTLTGLRQRRRYSTAGRGGRYSLFNGVRLFQKTLRRRPDPC